MSSSNANGTTDVAQQQIQANDEGNLRSDPKADLGLLQHPSLLQRVITKSSKVITKSSTLDVAAVLDPPLLIF